LSIYFLISELLPLIVVVYGIYLTIDWKNEPHAALKSSLIAVEVETALPHPPGRSNSFLDTTSPIQNSSEKDSDEE
jgi:hypothetical protein